MIEGRQCFVKASLEIVQRGRWNWTSQQFAPLYQKPRNQSGVDNSLGCRVEWWVGTKCKIESWGVMWNHKGIYADLCTALCLIFSMTIGMYSHSSLGMNAEPSFRQRMHKQLPCHGHLTPPCCNKVCRLNRWLLSASAANSTGHLSEMLLLWLHPLAFITV